MKWFVLVNDREQGPFTVQQIRNGSSLGKITEAIQNDIMAVLS